MEFHIQQRKIFVDKNVYIRKALEAQQISEVLVHSFSYLQQIYTDEFFTREINCTNLYAPNSGQLSFKAQTVDEVRFIWVEMFYNSVIRILLFIENITRRRFSAIRNNLHIVNINARKRDCADRLFKMRPIVELIRIG